MAGIDPGCVKVALDCVDGRVTAVRIASERQKLAPRLRGRAADEAVRLVPLLFALCGKAQGRAALLALAAARGGQREAFVDGEVEREALREHLWRWLLDAPPLFGLAALKEDFVAAAARVASAQRAELGALLASPRIEALRRHLVELDCVTPPPTRLLPPLDARTSMTCWPQLDAEFSQHPVWQGAAAETGALARRQDGAGSGVLGLAARWLARLDELRDWSRGEQKVGASGTASSVRVDDGRGRALVETARGLLMHEIVLDGERIADYFIVAPTEWNFHPRGSLVDWLTGRDANDREALQGLAARAIATLDPCVRWELDIDEA